MKTLREKLAELEHEQWVSWVEYLAKNLQGSSINTYIATRKANFLRKYEELPEEEKDKDRIWADKILKAVEEALPKENLIHVMIEKGVNKNKANSMQEFGNLCVKAYISQIKQILKEGV